jgi:HK97 family phage portal protein
VSWRQSVGRWIAGGEEGAVAPESRAEHAPGDIQLPTIRTGSEIFGAFTGGYVPMDGLPVVTERSALTITAIWACVSLIAGAISTLPMHLYSRASDGEQTLLPSDPLWWMLNEEFCPRWNAAAAWEWMILSRLFHGDAFAEILRAPGAGRITGMVPLHPMRTEPVPWADGSRLAYIVWPEPGVGPQDVRVLDQDDMLHVTGLGFNGTRSLSPLRHALSMSAGVALAAQNYAGQFFANNARPDYALVSQAKMDAVQVELLRAQVDEQHSQARGRGSRPMLLSGGLDIKQISLPSKDVEGIATRQFQIEEIARIYGVPPFMIGHNEKTTSWGTGISEMGLAFVRYVLRPHLNAIRTEINRKFFRTASKVADFDTFDLERADLKTLFETFRSALGRAGEPGFMTRDEVRRLINYGKTPDGGKFNEGTTNAQPVA